MTLSSAKLRSLSGQIRLTRKKAYRDKSKEFHPDKCGKEKEAEQSAARTENEKILATNASSEAPLERQKMIILFMKIRLLSLQSRAICN